jgi:chromosomal replication initiation ATPase DnaA
MTRDRQLPLPFIHQPRYDPDAFVPDPANAEALAWLDRTADWPDRRLLLWGDAGCGKSHLLHRWAARTGATVLTGPALRGLPDYPSGPGLAVDDADLVPQDTTLLHLLNTARDLRLPVLLVAREPPARWAERLPDLASRLRAITAVRVGPPSADLLRTLLRRLLLDRQIRADDELLDWMLRHLSRDPDLLRQCVARLDAAAYALNRPVTRALAVQVFTADDDCKTMHETAPQHAESE